MKINSQIPINDHSGFSLVELLLVCCITFILLAAAVPSIQRTLIAYRLESTSSLLSSRLLEAKLTAIKHNRTSSLKINTTERQFEIWTTDPGGSPQLVGMITKLPDGITVESGSPLEIYFTSLGRNIAAGSSIVKLLIPDTTYTKCITVTQAGNITVNNCP